MRLAILFSTAGAYGALGRDCRDGAELAVRHLREEGALRFSIETVLADPGGNSERYIDFASSLMREGCRHIIGTVTSQARKDVIPIVEKYDGQLWYVCPYEGFEANENVIYTGACPNQHLVPLFESLLPRFGNRVYLAGANYIWGWEMNRLARELVADAGGEIVGERCLPIEETNVDRLIGDIEARRPAFVLSNLIGPSSHAFLRAMRRLADRNCIFKPERCPVVSCDLTECELAEIGLGVADGHLATASYFGSLTTPENVRFRARVAEVFGEGREISSFFATSYATVRACAEAVGRCGNDEPALVRKALHRHKSDSMLGGLTVDAATNHAALPFYLGRVAGLGFDVLASSGIIAADPYLLGRRSKTEPSATARPRLRIVS